MKQIIEHIAAGLQKRGFNFRSPGTWVWCGITISFRPQDDSFLAQWTDGSREEYSFFDFAEDDEQRHYEFVRLMQWAVEHQLATASLQLLQPAA